MNSQITLQVKLAGRGDYHTVEILLDGDVAQVELAAACMRAINLQYPHFSGQPIAAIKYDIKANANG